MGAAAVAMARGEGLGSIPENSTFWKTTTCLPFFGFVPYLIQQASLDARMERERDPARAIELIEIKNQYKIAFLIYSLLSTALNIVVVATGLLSGGIICPVLCSVGMAAWLIFQIKKNNSIIDEIDRFGVVLPEMIS
jgi:hypothetical protein